MSAAHDVNNRKCRRWRSGKDKGNGRRNAFSAMTCWFVTVFVFEWCPTNEQPRKDQSEAFRSERKDGGMNNSERSGKRVMGWRVAWVFAFGVAMVLSLLCFAVTPAKAQKTTGRGKPLPVAIPRGLY